jgi:GTP-binding protein
VKAVKKESLPNVISADYLAEARTPAGVPPEGPPEIAIAGRSNVGKSTLLNRLAARRSLARTSKTPGRTRGIILYDLVAQLPGKPERTPLRLVDLPGYGYAQVSHEERLQWRTLIEGYVERRATLCLFLVLIDARRELQPDEAELLEWLDGLGVPHQLVVTKVDKLSNSERGAIKDRLRTRLGSAAPRTMLVSGETGEGVDLLWRVIGRHATGEEPGRRGSGPVSEGT